MQNGQTISTNRNTSKILYIILIAGLILRLGLALGTDNFNHPDEVYQILEQAHRIVFDYGFIPWEYRLDARGWLVPGLTALPLYFFKFTGLDSPHYYIPGLKIFFAIISSLMILVVFRIGRRLSHSDEGGLWAAFFFAGWYDIIYFSIRPLSEVWASFFFLLAIWLSLRENGRDVLIASALAIFTAALRVNYLPMVAIFMVILLYRSDNRSRVLSLAGAGGALILVGLIEWATLGKPFLSYYNYYMIDKEFFMQGSIGSTISLEFFLYIGYSSLFIIWLFLIGGILHLKKTYLVTTLIIIGLASHILIPAFKHQIAYRQIYLLIPLALILGANLVTLHCRKWSKNGYLLPLAIGTVFMIISIFGSFGSLPGQNRIYEDKMIDVYNETIYKSYDNLQAYLFLHDQDDLRGLYDNTDNWFKSGGFYYLHRDIPVYFYTRKARSPNFISHFMIKDKKYTPGFEFLKTFGEIIIYRRIDREFNYPIDTNYHHNLYQPGIDDISEL